ncbi:ABC transporter permease [Paenibacillus thermotolerans]|uniref:ABC transporter permease n=1 Tax=Paenibacillus thermotolerans TaxID=3027807 RepID=UPI00236812EE|nr:MULTISPECIES: ABC transporter permease [unclassified Paenibacillus]
MPKMIRFYTVLGWIAVAYMAALFLYPLLKVFMSSLTAGDAFALTNYERVFSSAVYTKVLGRTMWISFVSTAIALVLGYALAYFIATRPKKSQGMWLMLIISPMFMSLTIRLYGWLIVLSNEGPVTGLLGALSPSGEAPQLLFSAFSVIVGIVHYVLPFIVLNVYTSLKKLNESLVEASTMLGASRLRTFRLVTLPLSMPGVFAGGSIAFALSANTFLVPIMLGGPANGMLSNVAYNSIITIGNFGLGSAISVVLLVIVVIVLLIAGMLERRGHHAA